jgi:hypothetical protein
MSSVRSPLLGRLRSCHEGPRLPAQFHCRDQELNFSGVGHGQFETYFEVPKLRSLDALPRDSTEALAVCTGSCIENNALLPSQVRTHNAESRLPCHGQVLHTLDADGALAASKRLTTLRPNRRPAGTAPTIVIVSRLLRGYRSIVNSLLL